ncbi:hypothetical protein T03_4005 [Trichinella britovi]|uniref:Uncharacterized protein n=1 Tax=Trichinella britovi TaxID=45882 RepID=A0A0V1ALX9_TRIBR|nr:hypothetical protein T03_4005 [Trichinella britovi]
MSLELTLKNESSQLLGMTTDASQRHRHILMGWQTAKSSGLEITNITKNYNMNMGGIALNDILAALYRIEHKS